MIPTTRGQRRFADIVSLLLIIVAETASAAGKLVVEQPWVRAAPEGTMMLAGYARLRNAGDAPIVISSIGSADFASASMHETIEENGLSKMRELDRVEIAPGATVVFMPGGKHFMLMRPRHALKVGNTVTMTIEGSVVEFPVRDSAP